MARNALIQVRRDTAANWTSANPTLAAGEMGFETDTGKLKIGTGSTAWTSLLYTTDASDITGATLASNVVSSSLTSVGTLGSLDVNGTIEGTQFLQGTDYLSPYQGFRNKIINGTMQVSQRGTFFYFGSGGGNKYYGADRWRTQDYIWSAGSNITVSNETTVVPTGFTNSYKWANGATGLTFSSGGNQHIEQAVEGYDASALYGKTCSLSFWVRSSTAGKYSIFFYNNSFSRGLVKTYTINTANTWEYKTMTIDMASAISSGVWQKTTSRGLSVDFMLGTHADRTGNSLLDSWGSMPSYHYATSDSVNLATVANSTFYLTGVQLEQGSVATPFEQRPIGTELALCQRYYEKSFPLATAPQNNLYSVSTTGTVTYLDYWVLAMGWIPFSVEKRILPNMAFYGTPTNTWQAANSDGSWTNFASIAAYQGTVGIKTKGFGLGIHNNGANGINGVGYSRMCRGDWVAESEL